MSSKSTVTRHPLQRMTSPSSGISSIFHLLGIASFSASFAYLVAVPSFVNSSYGWHFQFLTILGLSVSTLTFISGFFADLTSSTTLFAIKNNLSLCSAPLEVLISILYWGICAIDPLLVVPPELELNSIADIGFHLMPALFLTGDLLFFSPPWKVDGWTASALSSAIAFGYWGWVEHCYKHNGWYPYPLFAALSTPQRALLFAASAVTMTGSTLMLRWLYGKVNGLEGEKNVKVANGKKSR